MVLMKTDIEDDGQDVDKQDPNNNKDEYENIILMEDEQNPNDNEDGDEKIILIKRLDDIKLSRLPASLCVANVSRALLYT